MKLFFLPVLLFFAIQLSIAQPQTESKSIFEKRREVKMEVIKLLSVPIIETTYEFVHDRNKGYGAYLLVNLDQSKDYNETFSLTPFFRMYFSRDEQYGAKGFFVEAFSSFFTGPSSRNGLGKDKNAFDVSLGFSLGQKWINSSGFVFEYRFGIGRNLLGNTREDFLAKGGLCVGYRF